MSRLRLLLALLTIGLIAPAAANAAVTVDQLQASDVVFDTGVTLGDADRARLQDAADDLKGKSFPTKFVVVAQRLQDLDRLAADLRSGLALRIGLENIDGVFILGPRELGIAADAFEQEKIDAFNAETDTLRTDSVQGMINVANRLQALDAAGALPGDTTSPKKGISGAIIGLIIAVGIAGIVAMAFARRAAKRGAERNLGDEQSALNLMVDALAANITDLGGDIAASPNAALAKPHFDEATAIYEQVRVAMGKPLTEKSAKDLGQDLVRGIRAAHAARAALDGTPTPAPETHEPPIMAGLCAFDPEHGKATETREITTPSGDRGTVPVCAACAAGLDRGETPAPRMLMLSGQQVPYWQGNLGALFGDDMLRQIMRSIRW